MKLERFEGQAWLLVASENTNPDGRIAFTPPLSSGTYRLTFIVKEHLRNAGCSPFFSEIPVVFEVTDPARKLHVPLLLSPYGYSTYRGS